MQKVVSLETAKKLVEAGIVLETEKYWETILHEGKEVPIKIIATREFNEKRAKHYLYRPSPDTVELLEALPNVIDMELDGKLSQGNFFIDRPSYYIFEVGYDGLDPISFAGELVEALAQLLLWVKTQEGEK